MKKLTFLIFLGLFCLNTFEICAQEQESEDLKTNIENKLKFLEKNKGIIATDSIFCYIIYENEEYFYGFKSNSTISTIVKTFKFSKKLIGKFDLYYDDILLIGEKTLSEYNIEDKTIFYLKQIE